MAAATDLAPDVVFAGDFRIVRPMTSGGMGAVYVVEQISTGMPRALKVMLPALVADPKARQRFEQEARVGSRIESEHVVQVVAAGVDGPTEMPWLAMELLQGEDLASLVRRAGPVPLDGVRDIVRQLGHALGAAHRAGIVHRDIKPENVFLATSRRAGAGAMIKVLDFGIAKVVADAKTGATAAVGSPMWMAPEQTASGGVVCPQTDVWALGLVVFYLLTGRLFWREAEEESTTLAALLRAIVLDPIKPASVRAAEVGMAGALPAWFDGWFDRAIRRDPGQRFADGQEAHAAFERMVVDPSAAAAPVGWSPPGPGFPPASGPPAWAPAVTTSGPLSRTGEGEGDAPAGVPRHRLGWLLAAAVGVAGVAAVIFGAHRALERHDLAMRHAELATCLLGSPLKAGESAGARVHRIQLAAIGGASESIGTAGEPPWPMRCWVQADALEKALVDDVRNDAWTKSVEVLTHQLAQIHSLDSTADLSGPVDAVFEEAAAANLDWTPSGAVTLPPAPVDAPTIDSLERGHPMFPKAFSTGKMFLSPFADAIVRFVIDDAPNGGPKLCSFTQPKRPIRCRTLAPPASQHSPGLRLWGTAADDVEPFVFGGARGRDGVFRAETGAMAVERSDHGAYGASSRTGGALDYLVWQSAPPGQMLWRHLDADGRTHETSVLRGENIGYPYYTTALLWDWFVFRKVVDEQIHLFVRRLPVDGTNPGPVEDLGATGPFGGQINGLEEGEPHVAGCRAGDTIVLRAKGWNRQHLWLRSAGRWTQPIEVPGTGGVLTCHEGEAVLTTVTAEGPPSVSQHRCTSGGCTLHSIVVRSVANGDRVPRSPSNLAIVDLGSQLLMVYYAGIAGGLRLRLAPIDRLDDASDTVLLDDHVKGGAFVSESQFSGFRVMAAEGGALLFVHTTAGVFAYWVDEATEPSVLPQPLQVEAIE
jgi:hypothetical protein